MDAALLDRRQQVEATKHKAPHLFSKAGQFLINLQFMKLSMLPGVLPGSLCLAGIWGSEKIPPLVLCAYGMTLKTLYSTEENKHMRKKLISKAKYPNSTGLKTK